MTTYLVQRPIFEVECDNGSCRARHRPRGQHYQASEYAARMDAQSAGWQVRPFKGPGSRSGPDLCPVHKDTDR